MKIDVLFLQGLNRKITFYIGQNKNENFEVIDNGEPDDLWFHANDISSCHIVAIIPKDISKNDKKYIIKTGALLCKKYTNKIKNLKSVEIIYTQIKNIVKTSVPGCVIINNNKKFITV
jgi:predicted ribosome quality control (RQC) complex YloA/Tae2 family protein